MSTRRYVYSIKYHTCLLYLITNINSTIELHVLSVVPNAFPKNPFLFVGKMYLFIYEILHSSVKIHTVLNTLSSMLSSNRKYLMSFLYFQRYIKVNITILIERRYLNIIIGHLTCFLRVLRFSPPIKLTATI